MPERKVGCYGCGREHRFDGPVPRAALCQDCGAYLRCCKGCKHHDESAYNECAEPMAERVVDKEASNFCDYFSPSITDSSGAAGPDSGARSALDDLFRK